MHEQESKKSSVVCYNLQVSVCTSNTSSKKLSHEQLIYHAYKILLKDEISDLVSLKSSNMKIFF